MIYVLGVAILRFGTNIGFAPVNRSAPNTLDFTSGALKMVLSPLKDLLVPVVVAPLSVASSPTPDKAFILEIKV